MNPKLLSSQTIDIVIPYQVVLTESGDALQVGVLGQGLDDTGSIIVFRVSEGIWKEQSNTPCEANGRLVPSGDSEGSLIWQSREGNLFYGEHCKFTCHNLTKYL